MSGLRPVGDLVVGMEVTGTVLSHQPWGMGVALDDFEPVGASIDLISRRAEPGVQSLADDLPPVGTTVQFRVGELRWHAGESRPWVRLTAAG